MRSRASMVVLLVAATVLLTAGNAWAPVPPKDCGRLEVGGKAFNIKADQMRCRRARRYSRRYLAEHDKPKGYSCKSYKPGETAIRFRCSKGIKVFFAIRR